LLTINFKFIFTIFLVSGFLSGNTQSSDSLLLKKHVHTLAETPGFRTYENVKGLNNVANYISSHMKQYSDSVRFQEYTVKGQTYKNVICSFGMEHSERIIVGAHYDVCENQPGADDNASGIAGLLELCRMLKDKKLNYRVDLVAYTLEEPPFFRSEFMGSHIHARYLADNKIPVKGMICLEMLGYFTDKKKTQDYPLGVLKMFYGSRGNYITVVQKYGGGKFSRKIKRGMKNQGLIKTKSFKGPKALPGIDFSDHLNYWKYGFSAVMITDTAFYRNKNYHQKGDVPELLDYKKMALVVDQVFNTIINL